jgi:hypothetical protein
METKETLAGLRSHFEMLDRDGFADGELHFEDTAVCCRSPFFSCRSCRCLLMRFVPEEYRSAITPCRHIPLTATGESLEIYYRTRTAQETHSAVRAWLSSTIETLESLVTAEVRDGKAA